MEVAELGPRDDAPDGETTRARPHPCDATDSFSCRYVARSERFGRIYLSSVSFSARFDRPNIFEHPRVAGRSLFNCKGPRELLITRDDPA